MDFNDIYCGDCIELMCELPSCSIALVITSPPYDNLRKYDGYSFDAVSTINELYRVMGENGIVVWVVGDATISGSETGTSFKQALMFMDAGFKLHDTMIYLKNSCTFPARANSNRYSQIFEYMFVFAKGKVSANLICDKPNKWAGHKDFSGKLKNPVPSHSPRNNAWKYTTSFNDKTGHPAVFPEELAKDHILSWSNEGDVVMDIFSGSGTTCKVAKMEGRQYLGFEISEEYCKSSKKRLEEIKSRQIRIQ